MIRDRRRTIQKHCGKLNKEVELVIEEKSPDGVTWVSVEENCLNWKECFQSNVDCKWAQGDIKSQYDWMKDDAKEH